VGAANQTTMLSTESLAIADAIGDSMAALRRRGANGRAFPQLRHHLQRHPGAAGRGQGAHEEPPDIMIVIGGYNSSNTNHLAHLCREYTTTYHISDATCIDPEAGTIRHKPELDADAPEDEGPDWLPGRARDLRVHRRRVHAQQQDRPDPGADPRHPGARRAGAGKRLWLVARGDTLFSAPIAVGSGQVFRFADRTYRFDTPRGQRRILAKDFTANWIPPDWHYFRKAAYRGIEPVQLADGDRVELSDGTFIEVRDKEVGRINQYDNWWPFSPGREIIFDDKIFIPPFGSPQRVIPNALGPVKLILGDGYLIHGTHDYNQQSIGTAASAGCIRMRNQDVEKLAQMVNVGTPVHIF
jgi:hypothetical protein